MVGSGMGTVRVRRKRECMYERLACACSAGAGEYWSTIICTLVCNKMCCKCDGCHLLCTRELVSRVHTDRRTPAHASWPPQTAPRFLPLAGLAAGPPLTRSSAAAAGRGCTARPAGRAWCRGASSSPATSTRPTLAGSARGRPGRRSADPTQKYAVMRAGIRYCAAYSEHRVSTTDRSTVSQRTTGEYS